MIRDTSPSDLPRRTNDGHPPVTIPIYVTALAEAWFAEATEEGFDNPKVLPELPYRASDTSTRCDRALHYKLNDVPKSNPPTIADQWRFRLGHLVHEGVQKFLPSIAPNARAEIEVDLRSIGIQGSGHCDMATFVCRADGAPMLPSDERSTTETVEIEDKDGNLTGEAETFERTERTYACADCDAMTRWLIVADDHGGGEWDAEVERGENVLELKSQGGFGFKMMATQFKGPAQGPRYGHILQGALAAAVLDADRVCVGYLSLENLSPSLAKDFANAEVSRFAAEWWFDMDELRPYVERERKRIERLLRFRGTDILPARELHDPDYPVGAVVIDPAPARGNAPWRVTIDGEVRSIGDTYVCAYCSHRDKCVADGPS